MKDFYDFWIISKQFSFDRAILAQAIKATFDRRGTAIPNDTPTALTDDFAADNDKLTQWRAFLRRNGLEDAAVELPKIIEELRVFLIPPLFSAANNEAFNKSWTNGGPWS